MITIAILDDAFEADINCIEDIYSKRLLPPRHSLHFKWKPERMKTPIFRQAEMTPEGIQTSLSKALRYYTYLHYLQRLGLQAGFMQILGSYCIRRGAGEAVESTLPLQLRSFP
jgi:hypothetical protein